MRTIPDVAFDADPNTGVQIYDSYDQANPCFQVGGTSVAAPCWAGLIAIADQGRVAAGGTTLDGPSQTLPALYSPACRRLPRHHQRFQRQQRDARVRYGHRAGQSAG